MLKKIQYELKITHLISNITHQPGYTRLPLHPPQTPLKLQSYKRAKTQKNKEVGKKPVPKHPETKTINLNQ